MSSCGAVASSTNDVSYSRKICFWQNSGQGKRFLLMSSISKSEPVSDRCTLSVMMTSLADGPTRVMQPSGLQSTCHAEIYSVPADLLNTSIRASPSGPDTPEAILSAIV